MSKEKDKKIQKDYKDSIQFEKELDEEALGVVFRLYDKTFKELVQR